jgi:indolepyruvate ferredoxin oxidoreductase alpha subunit
MDWILMPAMARKRWKELIEKQNVFASYSEETAANPLSLAGKKLGVITTGLAREYYWENEGELAERPSHLHISFYPAPAHKIRMLAERVDEILVIEEGYPLVERLLRGILPQAKRIKGKESGELPNDGELNPDLVRTALGLPVREGHAVKKLSPPGRPPQLCSGCPHADSFGALKEALKGFPNHAVTGDIGCYTLGALQPYDAIETCVDMGASIGMARGAAEMGLGPMVAVIGDSTFYHSGLTNLIDAVSHGTNMTVLILDNGIIAGFINA